VTGSTCVVIILWWKDVGECSRRCSRRCRRFTQSLTGPLTRQLRSNVWIRQSRWICWCQRCQ